MMKSRLYKLDDLSHKELKTNIDKVVKNIPNKKYENIIELKKIIINLQIEGKH